MKTGTTTKTSDQRGARAGKKAAPDSAQDFLKSNLADAYRTLSDHIKIGVFRSTPGAEGIILEANRALISMIGYEDRTEVVNHPAKNLYRNPEERAVLSEKIIQRGSVHDEEFLFKKRDGSSLPVSLSAVAVRDHSGEILYFDGLVEDISGWKKAEEDLRIQGTYFLSLLNSAPEAVIIHDMNDTVVNVNDEFLRMYGYSREEAIGKPINQIVASGELQDDAAKLSYNVGHGERVDVETQRCRKDGTCFPVSILGAPIFHKGTQIGVYAIYRDLTERKKAEQEILIQKSYFERLFNSALEAILLYDINDRVIDVNEEFTRMYGYSREEAIGRQVNDLVAPPELLEEAKLFSRMSCNREPVFAETKRKRKDGALMDVSVIGAPVMYGDKQIAAYAIYRDITERKKAEQALFQAEFNYRLLFEKNLAGIYKTTIEGAILQCNPAFATMLGYENQAELMLHQAYDLYSQRTERQEFLAQLQRSGSLENRETVLRKKDGTLIAAIENVVLLRDERNPESSVLMGTLIDVTQRRQAESALRENEEKYRILVETMNEGLMQVDNDDVIQFVNIRFCTMLGYSADELIGKVSHKLLMGEEEQKIILEKNRLRKQGFSDVYEITMRRKSGKTIWVQISGSPIYDKTNTVVGSIGTVLDITKRKKSEDTLKLLNKAVQSSGEIIYMTAPDETFTFVNPAFTRAYGYTPEEVIGKKTPLFLESADQDPSLHELLRTTIQRKGTFSAIFNNRAKNGSVIPVEVSANPILDSEDRVAGYLAIQRDISERLRAEKEYKDLEQKLIQAQKLESIGTLAGGIAHDFNNILSIILGYSSLIQKANPTSAPLQQNLQVIDSAVQRGADLVKQILTFARKSDTVYGLLDTSVIIKELVKMLSETFPKIIAISTELDRSIPPIVADPTQIYQTLMNLCVNARDAMPEGGTLTLSTEVVKQEIVKKRFSEASEEKYLCISVRDTGTGMDNKTAARIFDPFFTTKEQGKGTGLGLAVVYGVVKSHRGHVEVESEPGNGTVFRLYFPIPKKSEDAVSERKQKQEEILGGTETILFVEDEEALRGLVRIMLEMNGYTVLAAKDGEQAWELYQTHKEKIDLVFTDIGLPKLTGPQLFSRLKEIDPTVRLIFATGFIEPEEKSELLKSGAKNILLKPYDPNKILKGVREVLDMKK